MRMMFVARALGNMAGGVERMVTAVMNEMVARGHQTALFSWDLADAKAFYPMAKEIRWYKLDMGDPMQKAGSRMLLKRLPKVRRMVREFNPEVIVCFQGGPFMAMRVFTLGMGIPLIAAERTSPLIYEHANSSRQRFIERQAFRTAKLITVQVERYRTFYPEYLRHKIVTIPNPVAPARRLAMAATPGPYGRYRLLSVGRLGYQKNIGVLIDAFAELAPGFPDWDLRIVGEGEGRKDLEAQIIRLTLSGRVALPGATTDVESEYVAAQLFCLPARWEGFPNALAEALAHGLPSVGFDGCAGVPDLIMAGESGILAEGNNDAATLTDALAKLLGAHELRARMGEAARASMVQYAPTAMFDLWERTLLSLQGR
jgi:glycosyltransferase involved in cell wall biosynthesis